MDQSARNRRSLSNFWINPRFQGRYVSWVAFSGAMLLVTNVTIFYVFTSANYDLLASMLPISDTAREAMENGLVKISVLLVATGVLNLLFLIILAIALSHSAAGAIYNLKQTFTAIRLGDRSARVKLRPGDDFHDVANEFNALMDRVFESKNEKS